MKRDRRQEKGDRRKEIGDRERRQVIVGWTKIN